MAGKRDLLPQDLRERARTGGPVERSGSTGTSSKPPWPVLDDEALCGLAGEVVLAMLPHTEADKVALLSSLLAACGNAMGRGAHMRIGEDRHYLNLNVGLVGETSKGRKGMSWNLVKNLVHGADTFWAEERIMGGLSSGEGLIFAVRDRRVDEDADGNLVVIDAGADDKRLMVVEGEFAGPFKAMTRSGNNLSVLIRQAWDGGKLATLTRNSPLKATDAHISVIGHITGTELLRLLSETDAHNGFANRFLWLLVRRSKELPFGGDWTGAEAAPLILATKDAVEFGREHREIGWGEDARGRWTEVYGKLSEGKPGLFGAVTSRAEVQVLRLAALYAVMDRQPAIQSAHLEAALALWRYAEGSALYIFGDATGDRVADRIAAALEEEPYGLTRTEITDLFSRNVGRDRIEQALALLERLGRVRREVVQTGGRPAERWLLE
jgi:hypothetical protein